MTLDFCATLFFLNSKPVHFIMKIFSYKSLMTCISFLHIFFSLWHHGDCQRPFLFLWYECYQTTIPVELGFLWDFVFLKLKIVHFIMKIFFYKSLMTCIPRFLHIFFFSLWHYGGCQRLFPFLWYECYLTTIPVVVGV